MIGRTCPIHGEYSASGVCRWCEKPSGADQSTITLPLMCICKTCLCGFDAPIPLTSLECPECRAKSQPAPLSKGVSLPGLKGLWQKPDRVEVNEAGVPTYTWTIGPEVDSFEKLARIANVDHAPPITGKIVLHAMLKWEARLAASRFRYDVLMVKNWHSELAVAEEANLLEEHTALRWERVARRWNYKHRRPGGLDEEGRARVWLHWLDQQQRIFDDGDWRERQRRRMDDLIAAGIPKEWP